MAVIRMGRVCTSGWLFGILALTAFFAVPGHAADHADGKVVATQSQPGKRIAQLVTIRPKPGMESELAARLLALAGPTRHEGGNLRYDLFQKEGGSWVIFEYWADDAALAAHFAAPYSAAFLKDMGKFVDGTPEVATLQGVDVAR